MVGWGYRESLGSFDFAFQICRYLRGRKKTEVGDRGKKWESAETCITEDEGNRQLKCYSVYKVVKSVFQRSQGCKCRWSVNYAAATVAIKALKSAVWGDAWKPASCKR